MTQLGLLGSTDAPRLTDRQQHALKAFARLREFTEDEIGRDLHAWQDKHPNDEVCKWCETAGLEVLRALRRKGLVVQRRSRGGVWELTAEGRAFTERESSTEDRRAADGANMSLRGAKPAQHSRSASATEDPADVFGF